MKHIHLSTTIALICLGLLSCVSKGNYNMVSSERDKLAKTAEAESQKRAALSKEAHALDERASLLADQNQQLRNTNQLLADKNSHLSQQILTLRDEILQVKKNSQKREKSLELGSQTYEDLVRSLKQDVISCQASLQQSKGQLKVNLVERITFTGGVEIDAKGKELLDKIVPILKEVKNKRIQVEGHGDNSPIPESMSSTYPSNWELSSRRASEVVRYLVSQGVEANKLAVVAHGDAQPLADNASADGRRKNRRVEIVLMPTPKIAAEPIP